MGIESRKKLQMMINISEAWALTGLRFQMPGSYCRCAIEIKLPTFQGTVTLEQNMARS